MPAPLRPVELTADGLLLRPWRPDDAEAVYQLCQDPAVQRWTSVPSPYRRADAETFTAEFSPQAWAGGTGALFAVCDAGSGELLASVGLKRAGDPRQAELGYWCGAPARGRGVVVAASRALCRWGFTELGLARIGWYAAVGNEASLRVALRLGFRYEGRIRALLSGGGDGSRYEDAWSAGLLPGELADIAVPLPYGPDPELTDGPVTVRRWTAADVDDYVALRNEATVRTWDPPEFALRTREEVCDQICVRDVEGWLTGGTFGFAVTAGGTVAGGIGVRRSHERVVEIGWWLGAEQRGQGVAGRAVGLVTGWLEQHGIPRVEARIHTGNAASRALAERTGFTREGIARGDAPHHTGWGGDSYLYGLRTNTGLR